MLPSTGYFNGINCPFYENGLCERPYCHFRHVKKEVPSTTNDGIESGAILQKLVSAAVQKVLQQTEVSGSLSSTHVSVIDTHVNTILNAPSTKATYNPTPISELNKINNTDAENIDESNEQKRRHIPVPYTPRKPAGLPLKRPIDTNGSKPFVFNLPIAKYTPGSADNVQNDKYTPPGTVDSKEVYLPGTEKQLQEYTPDTTSPDQPNKRNYVPSSEKSNKSKILEYRPAKVSASADKPVVTYQPTPRSLAPCFSSDEEDSVPTKKRKISNDLNGLDDLGPEFDILDQILDEEKGSKKEGLEKKLSKSKVSDDKHNKSDTSKKEKTESSKTHKSHHKSKSDKNDSSSSINHKKESSSSTDNKKERSSSIDNKKDRSTSSNSKKERSTSSDIKKERSTSSDVRKERSTSSDNKKERSTSSDNKKETKDKNKKDKHKDKKLKHKISSKNKEKEKKNTSKHNDDKNKHRSRSHSPKHSKNSSCKSSEKHSTSKSSRTSKSREHKEKHRKKSKDKHDKDKSIDLDDSDNNDYVENDNVEEDEISDADEDAIEQECMKIFEEYVPTEKPKTAEDIHRTQDLDENEYIPGKKRVSRTSNKDIKVLPKPTLKPDFKVSAAQAMAERLTKVKEFHNSRGQSSTNIENSNVKTDLPKTISATNTGNVKIRIAHVPYATTLVSAKKTISPAQATGKVDVSASSTISQTVKKGSQRVAHVPSDKFIDRPGVLEPLGSKIPANIRSTFLNKMIDECLKLYISVTDAYNRAQNEELNTSKKCSTVQIYKNSAVMTISKLRRELQESNGVKKSESSGNTHTNSLGSWSIEGRNRKTNENSKEFVGARFYKNVKKWVLTDEQLKENGFPRPHPSGEKGRATISGQNKQKPPRGFIRTCCRCKNEYTVNKKGFAAVKEECIYHPNNKYRVRGEARYQCCSQDATSDGCCVAPCHVYEYVDYDNLKGFVTTLPPVENKDDYGVYSLDCEMCYTTHGLDLTRVTVINSDCKVVYETLIKPLHPIIDYNTRYSGITEEQMSQVRTTLLEVQATLLTMFNSKTILVGHSLESDFKALKLIHDTVVDTSVLFPHKMGPPYKRALRNLSSEHLKKIIQNSVDGHDSAEDAMVCMELLHFKLKEELKTR